MENEENEATSLALKVKPLKVEDFKNEGESWKSDKTEIM